MRFRRARKLLGVQESLAEFAVEALRASVLSRRFRFNAQGLDSYLPQPVRSAFRNELPAVAAANVPRNIRMADNSARVSMISRPRWCRHLFKARCPAVENRSQAIGRFLESDWAGRLWMSGKRRRRHAPDEVVRTLRDADAIRNGGKDAAVTLEFLDVSEDLSKMRNHYGRQLAKALGGRQQSLGSDWWPTTRRTLLLGLEAKRFQVHLPDRLHRRTSDTARFANGLCAMILLSGPQSSAIAERHSPPRATTSTAWPPRKA